MLAHLGTAVIVFIATNIDDILLLAALFGAGLATRAVVAGQFIGIAVLTAVSVGAAYAASTVPAEWIKWFGLLPLALGLWLLLQLWRRRNVGGEGDEDDDSAASVLAERKLAASLHSQALGVAAITIANGGDNVGVYIPLFAQDVSVLPLYIGVFALLTGLWCWLGHALVKHPVGGAVMQRWGHVLLPIVLIAIGVHILL